MTTILIIAGLILLLFFLKKISISQNSTNREKENSANKYETEVSDENDRICFNCGGFGWEYYCENCLSKATFFDSSEYYDGDPYCSKCMEEGKEFLNIVEDLCTICGGTGKHYEEN